MREQYEVISEVFLYPKKGYKEKVMLCLQYLREFYPDAATSFERFAAFVAEKSLSDIEEIFGVTFHIQAICFLDIGYVLFGEDYSRGEFLLNMKKEQAGVNHDCGEELADNLPHVLKFMALTKDENFLQELASLALIPAVEKMLEEFEAGRMALKHKIVKKKQKAVIMENVSNGNIYQNAIQALLIVLHKDFEDVYFAEAVPSTTAIPPGLANFCGTRSGSCSITNNKTVKK